MTTTDLSTVRCPSCGSRPDATQCVTSPDARPSTGDVCICASCWRVAVYTDTGKRQPTPAELDDLATNPDVRRGLRIIAQVKGGDLKGGL